MKGILLKQTLLIMCFLMLAACDPLGLAHRKDVDYTGMSGSYSCSYREAESIVSGIFQNHGVRHLREHKCPNTHADCMFYGSVVNMQQPQGGIVIVDIQPVDGFRQNLSTVIVKSYSIELSERMFHYEFTERLEDIRAGHPHGEASKVVKTW